MRECDLALEQAFKKLERAKKHHRGVREARVAHDTAVWSAMQIQRRGFTSWYWMSGFLEPGSATAKKALQRLSKLAKPRRPNAVDVVERIANDPALVEHRRQTLGFAQAA
jgi:hypothetical protein